MADVSNNNVLSYPTMTRQRADKIQAKEIAYAEDVNAEFDHIVDTYNRLVLLLTGEWGDGTGRIYDLVDNAVSLANSAIAKANDCVQKSGDTMTGQLNIALVPSSDYNVVNKKYVDDTIDAELSGPVNRIQQLEDWKENLNATQVKLDNVNFASNNVNDGMNELFISVSSGKATVAAAITGKGIQTASDASFKQMADNINAILTFNEGTAGGTATAADIMYGKTAYARGGLIVGNYIPLDLSDATATSDKILEGYTAYVGGGKIIGTYVPPKDYPIYGTDTSNATATEADIAYGKTAYARGQLLIGTMTNTEVEEIYGLSADGASIKNFNSYLTRDPELNKKLNSGSVFFSKNLDYAITTQTDEDGNKYIYSLPVGQDGVYVMASTSMGGETTYKKYRYTDQELFGGVEGTILEMAIGAGGVDGDPKKCYLYIIRKEGDKQYLYVKTYHLRENGVIGREYAGEETIDLKYVLNLKDRENAVIRIIPCNLSIEKFFIIYVKDSYIYKDAIGIILCKLYNNNVLFGTEKLHQFSDSNVNINYIDIAQNDKYIFNTSNVSYTTPFIKIATDSDYSTSTGYGTANRMFSYNTQKDIFASINTIYTNRLEILKINKMNDVTNSNNIVKTINLATVSGSTDIKFLKAYVYDTFIAVIGRTNSSPFTYRVYIYLKKIDEIADGETINADNEFDIQTTTSSSLVTKEDFDLSKIIYNSNLKIAFQTDIDNIIGVKYKNKIFYAINNELTATSSDVKIGKTFVGQNGTVEKGIMEV